MSEPGKLKYALIFTVSVALSISLSGLQADPLIFSSGPKQTALLELYTSEGCSSCPPADRWLSNLRNDNKLWQDFIPVAFHVDYWDYIGWKDRFASPAYSKRQGRYAQEQSLSTVYTPGLILNGKEWRRRTSKGIIEKNEQRMPGLLEMKVTGNFVFIDFKATEVSNEHLELYLALLGFKLETDVKAGENRNKKLTHDFVVLALEHSRLELKGSTYQTRLLLPETKISAVKYGLVAWVSKVALQQPIQATGGWLPGDILAER